MTTDVVKKTRTSLQGLEFRFWSLVSFVLVLAIGMCLGAVLLVSRPYLLETQRQALEDVANKNATLLSVALQEQGQFLTFMAANPNLVDLVVGNSTSTSAIEAYLDLLPIPENVLRLEVHDILETPVFRHVLNAQGASEESLTRHRPIRDALAETNSAPFYVELVEQGDRLRVILSAPIRQFGFVEGAISSEILLDTHNLTTQTPLAENVRIVGSRALRLEPDDVTVALGSWDLVVVMTPDHAQMAQLGRELIETVALAVAGTLILPFVIFGLLGRSVIVQPHIRLQKSEAQLIEQKNKLAELAAVAQHASDSIIVTDLDERIIWVNPAFERMTGYAANEVRGQRPGDFLQTETSSETAKAKIRKALNARRNVETEIENVRKTGTPYRVKLSITPLVNSDGQVYGFMSLQHDVTEQTNQREALIAANRRIEYQARHDSLTGLPNRRALDQAVVDRFNDGIDEMTLVRIDLDHFKHVNDTMGHAAGDHVLTEVADILREETKSEDFPARVGGDEFVILSALGTTSSGAKRLANRLLQRIRQPMYFEGKTIQVGASFGIASTLDGLLGPEEMIVGADAALYTAKERGRNTVELYSPELHNKAMEMRDLAQDLRTALGDQDFVAFYQPQFEAGSRRVSGVETLVRWPHPTRGLLMPSVFLPIAQQLSLLDEIDAHVLKSALSDCRALDKAGLTVPKMSFNVTAQRLKSNAVLETILRERPDNTRISLEILESVLLEDQATEFRFRLDKLREAGIGIEIDDFGSGHASIVSLMETVPDAMKIDQRLIAGMAESPLKTSMIEAAISIAKAMNIDSIAEGVETETQARMLEEMGVTHLQGHLFARAMSLENLQEFFKTYQPQPIPRKVAP